MRLPSFVRLPTLLVTLVILMNCSGCDGGAKSRQNLERTLNRSATVFVCIRENGHYIVKKILKAEPSWGSNISVGDSIDLPVRDDPKDAGVLVTRENFQWAANGQLAQGAIPFDRAGRLLIGRMTLQEVEQFLGSKGRGEHARP